MNGPGDPLRVAIVDDNRDDRVAVRAALRRGSPRKYDLSEETSVEGALRLCAATPSPDCMILDFNLPDGTAIDVLQEMPKDELGISCSAVVILAGGSSTMESRSVLRAGAHDFVGKDWMSPETLTRAVENALERRSAEKQREELLAAERAARVDLERAARVRDEFLATLSHELRTPLSAIVGWAQVLQRPGVRPETVAKGIQIIARNAQAQATLIADLLDMNRLLSGRMALEVEPCDIDLVVAAAAETVRGAANIKGVKLDLSLDGRLPEILGDRVRLQQVFWNLLSNSVKFTPPGGRISLATGVQDGQVEVVVTDTGHGIEPDFLPRLFERFAQADGSTSRRHGGLGLGLAIVKQLVDLHSGTVTAESEGPGRGARFTVRLPPAGARRGGAAWIAKLGRLPMGSDTVTPKVTDPLPRELEGLSVLVVDDQIDTLELIERWLGESGAVVVTADSGEAALQRLRVERPNLLFSDIGMPGMDGYQLIREVRGRLHLGPGELPAVALTAFARTEDRERALAAGYQMHLSKPIDACSLVAAAAELSRRSPAPPR